MRAAEISAAAAAPRTRALLLGVADHSPYLWQLITSDPGRLVRLLAAPPELRLSELLRDLASAQAKTDSEAELMRLLRRAKQEVALLVALADLGGVWKTETVMAGADRKRRRLRLDRLELHPS